MNRIETSNAKGVTRHLLWGPVWVLWMLSAVPVAAESPGHNSTGAARADAVVGNGAPASCTETDFDTALDTVQESGGGTITFNCGGAHIIVFKNSQLITSQVIVDGGGVITLSGGNATRLFYVSSNARLELRNITLSNGYAFGDGGAIFSFGTLHLANTTFRNNRTSIEGGSGGAIINEGPMTAVNSSFENNWAANGGAVYLRSAAGVGTFTNTTFKDNKTLSETNGWGGAILLWDGAHLTVRACDFEGNSARRGGAINNRFANVALAIEQGTLIRSNTAQHGGGLWLQAGTTVIDKSMIVGNLAQALNGGLGGGIYHEGGTLTIIDSTIAENNAGFGGGLAARNGDSSLTGTTLVDNLAGSGNGGGIYFESSAGINAKLSLLNSTLSGNSANWIGGAISTFATSAMAIDLRHVTIAANVAGEAGGGLTVQPNNQDVTLTLVNSALAGNSSPTCEISASIAAAATARYSLWSDTSCAFGTSMQNHPNTQAALGPLADNGGRTLTRAPLEGSPLIDNGICLTGITTDQRGANRLHGPACDIGSVEAGAAFLDSIFADRFASISQSP